MWIGCVFWRFGDCLLSWLKIMMFWLVLKIVWCFLCLMNGWEERIWWLVWWFGDVCLKIFLVWIWVWILIYCIWFGRGWIIWSYCEIFWISYFIFMLRMCELIRSDLIKLEFLWCWLNIICWSYLVLVKLIGVNFFLFWWILVIVVLYVLRLKIVFLRVLWRFVVCYLFKVIFICEIIFFSLVKIYLKNFFCWIFICSIC